MELETLQVLEAICVEHPVFGDSTYIREQFHACYKRRLGKLSADLPAAAKLLDALGRSSTSRAGSLLDDTVVRCAINDALQRLETDEVERERLDSGLSLDLCEEVFEATRDFLDKDIVGGPLEVGISHVSRLEPEVSQTWIWSEEHSDDIFGRCFRYLTQTHYGPLCTPSSDEIAILNDGAKLLGSLLPRLTRSAFSHAHVVAVFPALGWKGQASSSNIKIGGTIFLNREMLHSPWWVAEHLLHEALHQKLYDFRHGHTLLARDSLPVIDSTKDDVPVICSLWNMPDSNKSNYWDPHRAVAAFHVYVHLSVLSKLAEIKAPQLRNTYGQMRAIIQSTAAMERARYLGEKLEDVCKDELGLAGKRFVEWLRMILDALDPPPREGGSYVRLLLSRYQREARRVQKKFCLSEDKAEFYEQLARITGEEVEYARRFISTVGSEDGLSRFNNELAEVLRDECGYSFAGMRGLIAETIEALCSSTSKIEGGALEFAGGSEAEKIVREMVESSSRVLQEVLAESIHRV